MVAAEPRTPTPNLEPRDRETLNRATRHFEALKPRNLWI
jgi:hypothetical protein